MYRKIAIILYPELAALDVTGPADVFAAATLLLAQKGKENSGYDLSYTGVTTAPVATHSGLTFQVDAVAGTGDPLDTLIVPGGLNAEAASTDPELIRVIRADAGNADRVMSVCSGTFMLAASGLLEGKRVTTHWMVADRLAELYPGIKVEPDAIYIRDGRIATSAGVTAGIDLALAIVEEDHGPQLTMDIARLLLLYRRRPGTQSQFSAPLLAQSDAVGRFGPLCTWMDMNLNNELHVEELAQRANMSPRNFARVFQSEMGMSPGRYVERLRLGRARELLEAGRHTIEAIAEMTGFGREERLRRAFQRSLGVNPRQYRDHFQAPQGPNQ